MKESFSILAVTASDTGNFVAVLVGRLYGHLQVIKEGVELLGIELGMALQDELNALTKAFKFGPHEQDLLCQGGIARGMQGQLVERALEGLNSIEAERYHAGSYVVDRLARRERHGLHLNPERRAICQSIDDACEFPPRFSSFAGGNPYCNASGSDDSDDGRYGLEPSSQPLMSFDPSQKWLHADPSSVMTLAKSYALRQGVGE